MMISCTRHTFPVQWYDYSSIPLNKALFPRGGGGCITRGCAINFPMMTSLTELYTTPKRPLQLFPSAHCRWSSCYGQIQHCNVRSRSCTCLPAIVGLLLQPSTNMGLSTKWQGYGHFIDNPPNLPLTSLESLKQKKEKKTPSKSHGSTKNKKDFCLMFRNSPYI